MSLRIENARLIDPEAGTDTLGTLTVLDGKIARPGVAVQRVRCR